MRVNDVSVQVRAPQQVVIYVIILVLVMVGHWPL